uniref:(RS)-norcoclaurine 6-O-methyltransferase n=2 Tax=Thalictrum flavum TaxID=150094 RepID=6OMT_THLFG|nr:RecName: Full=(RS)-norcoclaurine 6-O-methyltransferase [Thalictrum flavum subsp. glaucum]AAU20765.1 (S)-norcoclaurine 6-O-methyltransferase [Thalictrum flavum subsp. glaucum]
MEMINKENLSSQAKLWNFIYGFADSLVLKSAVQLDLANIIHNHGSPMTLSELSLHLPSQPVNQDALYRVLRYLVHMKLFTKSSIDGELRYGLAPPAKFLVKGWDKCMLGAILTITDKDFMAPWHYLKEGILNDGSTSTAFEKALGTNIWDYMAEHPEKNQLFNEGMANDTRLIMSALVKECSSMFDGITTIVDVGGGTGTAVRNIAKAFPHIKCTVYDLPHVIADSPGYTEINSIQGDMFKYIPNADAIMMKCILHDWDDKECIEILKRCKDAVPRDGGKVIIIDIILDVKSEHPYTKMRLTLDLDMMLNTGGKERTEEEWKKLIHDAGYKGYKITHISAVQSVIEAYPY